MIYSVGVRADPLQCSAVPREKGAGSGSHLGFFSTRDVLLYLSKELLEGLPGRVNRSYKSNDREIDS